MSSVELACMVLPNGVLLTLKQLSVFKRTQFGPGGQSESKLHLVVWGVTPNNSLKTAARVLPVTCLPGKGRHFHCGSCRLPPSPCDWNQRYFGRTSELEAVGKSDELNTSPQTKRSHVSYCKNVFISTREESRQFRLTWLLLNDFFRGEMELRPVIPPPIPPRLYSRTPCVPPQPPYPPGLQEVDVGVEGLW